MFALVANIVSIKKVESSGTIKILKVDAVIDCGIVVNPSGAKAQVEGGILEGLSAAMYGEITIKEGVTQQSNFHDYRWMRMNEAPEILVEFVLVFEHIRIFSGDLKLHSSCEKLNFLELLEGEMSQDLF